ncbi:MAG: ATP-binding protein [Kiritimatiellae bacterium]|nr:ATP-binding protein [Kiritimatiellia bacterium]
MAKLSFILCKMTSGKQAISICLIVAALHSLNLAGAENSPLPPALADRYTVRRWTLDDGLPDSQICGVAPGNDGGLWLVTPRFLVRFDGNTFTSMSMPEQTLQGLNESLFIDSSGGVWVYGHNGAFRYHEKTGWQNLNGLVPPGRVTGIAEAPEDVLFIAHRDGVYALKNGSIRLVLPESELLSDGVGTIRNIASADDKTLLIDTGETIYAWNITPDKKFSLNAAMRATVLLTNTASKQPLAYANSRCMRFKEGRWQPLPEIRPVKPRSYLELPDGSLWIGHDAGIDVFDGSDWQTQTQSVLYGPASVLSMAIDKESNIWIATTEGLMRLRRRVLYGVPLDGSADSAKISVLWVENKNRLWAGLLPGGLAMGDADGLEPLLVPPDFSDVALNALYREKNGKLWCGGSGGSLWTLQNQSLQRIEGVYAEGVRAITGRGDVPTWVATRRGLLMYNLEKNRLVEMAWPMDPVLALWLDNDKTLWVAHESRGLAAFGSESNTNERFYETIHPIRTIRTLYRDRDNILWVGGIAGLARLNGESAFIFRNTHGLWNESIRQVSEDNKGFLWLGSAEGIMRVAKRDFAEVADGLKRHLSVRIFGAEAGMDNESCSGGVFFPFGEPPCERLWFPTAGGLLTIDTQSLPARRPAAKIEFVSIEPGVYVELAHTLDRFIRRETAPAGNPREILIKYTALDFATPERVRFLHRLTGPVTQESGLTEERQVVFSRLPPGNYKFTLNACNGDGVWCPESAAIYWSVKPFFWETGAFRLITVLLCGGILVIIVRTNERKRSRLKIEAAEREQSLERERARIARDLHDEIGAKLTRLSLLGTMVSEDSQHDESLRCQIDEMAESARETHRAFDEIVWSVSPRNDTVKSLSHYICKYAEDFFSSTPVACSYDLQETMRDNPIDPQRRHHFFLSVKECLNNILKHSGATKVSISIRQMENNLVVEVADNGCGFAPQDVGRHGNGLLNMRERMRTLGGAFEINSSEGQGATLKFAMPI